MKILIYGINYSPELTGIGKYSGEMGAWLAGRHHEVRVITAPPYYPDWRVGDEYSAWQYRREMLDGVDVMRCPVYVPENPSTLKRLLHLSSFAISSGLRLVSQLFWRPDVVICVVPTQFCSIATILFSALSRTKSVIHIQDYELDAMFGLGMAGESKFRNLAFAVERWLLRRFSRVSSISQSMLNKAKIKGVDTEKLLFFPNWSETSHFKGIQTEQIQSLRLRLGISSGVRVVLYSGNIGEKQGLESVIDAAKYWANDDSVVFLVVGRGAGKARLEQLAERNGLRNIIFSDLLPFDELPVLLSIADCHLVVQRRGVADAVLPSKLTNILAVGGNAVITAEADTELGVLCDQYPGIATLVEPESVNALVDGIERTLAMPKPNHIASDYAQQNIEKDRVLYDFESELKSLAAS